MHSNSGVVESVFTVPKLRQAIVDWLRPTGIEPWEYRITLTFADMVSDEDAKKAVARYLGLMRIREKDWPMCGIIVFQHQDQRKVLHCHVLLHTTKPLNVGKRTSEWNAEYGDGKEYACKIEEYEKGRKGDCYVINHLVDRDDDNIEFFRVENFGRLLLIRQN